MKRLKFRGSDVETLIAGAAVLFALSCLVLWREIPSLARSVLVVAGAVLFYPGARRIYDCWRQTLVLESDQLIYFDGQTQREFQLADIQMIRLNRWGGNLRARQNAGHSLALLPRNGGQVEHWELSAFSLRVVLRLLCEIARLCDWPPVEIYQTEFQNLKAELQGAVRGLGTLSPAPLDEVDETTLSRWDREIRGYERRYLFTPRR